MLQFPVDKNSKERPTRKFKSQQFKQKINQPAAKVSPVCYLTFICSSTCFGRPHAHHQELNN
jgi:hypothetical protein